MNFKQVSRSGFTLVELMVVVAIIGILSAIAIPNFKKYQSKSKTSEAKLQLAALYTAEVSFSTDFDVYATCLDTMGYDPSSNLDSRYYSVGFSAHLAAANSNAVANGADTCLGTTNFWYIAGKTVGGAKADTPATYLAGASVTAATFDGFTAAAAGVLDASKTAAGTADKWTIDQDKKLSHPQPGY